MPTKAMKMSAKCRKNQETSMERSNRMDDNRFAKIVQNGKINISYFDRLQNVDAKVERQHCKKTGTLDKI